MTAEQAAALIERLERLPVQVDHLVTGLTPSRLTTPFLPDEWTVAQNVHHLADSHMNAYIRCKLMLTEAEPPLKPYDQDAWAALPDAGEAQLATSLNLLQGLHARWGQFFRALGDGDWARAGHHPENGRGDAGRPTAPLHRPRAGPHRPDATHPRRPISRATQGQDSAAGTHRP
jgi:hypothetical protein